MNKDTFNFLSELSGNNNRDWFAINKHRFIEIKSDFENDIRVLLSKMGEFDDELKGLQMERCVYRIYKDMRFSADKTPYKTNLGAFITKFGKKLDRAGYYLHIEPGKSMICAGLWFPSPALLKAERRAIYDNIEEFSDIINEECFIKCFGGLNFENSLKKLPPGFDKNFEYPELLKLKDFGVVKYLPDKFFFEDDWINSACKIFSYTKPLNDFLNFIIDEENL